MQEHHIKMAAGLSPCFDRKQMLVHKGRQDAAYKLHRLNARFLY